MADVLSFLIGGGTEVSKSRVRRRSRGRRRRGLGDADHDRLSVSLDELVDMTFRKAFVVDAATVQNKLENSGIHITSHLISSTKRASLIRSLEDDLILGPLLRIFRKILRA